MNTNRISIAKALVNEARMARLGQGHWSECSMAVRMGNARTNLLLAAAYRTNTV